MAAKSARRLLAEKLGIEEGLSYSEITARTGIGQSTLSGWLRHIQLTPAQQARLDGKLKAHRAGFGARVWPIHRDRFDRAREEAARAGAEVAAQLPDDDDVVELALATLYLGEGSKTGNRVQLANMDPVILRFFLWALRRLYAIDERRVSFRLHLAEVARCREAQIKAWWGQQLGCSPSRFRKTQFDARASKTQLTDIYCGVCSITYADTYLQERLLSLAQVYLDTRKGPLENKQD